MVFQVTVCFAISMSCVLVSGQFFGSYDNAYRFGYDSNDFGGISSFGQANGGAASIRDPRQNRGKNLYYYTFLCLLGLVRFHVSRPWRPSYVITNYDKKVIF